MAEPAPTSPRSRSLRPVPGPFSPIAVRKWLGFPAPLSPLIGREREVDALCALLRDPSRRLITLTGPGGSGKTRLAIEAAQRASADFPDGGAFVPLAAVSDAALILPAIAQLLDVLGGPGRSLQESLVMALQSRHLLLVLDNLEHLVGATATADIAALLQGCPGLTILATSRSLLRIHDERRFSTPPLAVPKTANALPLDALGDYGAIALFVARAQAINRDFALDATNASILVEICRRLDGLPLAIELAAAWVRVLSPAALLERLEPRLPLLRGGGDDLPARLRTMRDAIAWSYDLLSPEERALFRRLAVFSGGFTLEAAEAVAGGAAVRGRRGEGGEGGEGGEDGEPASRQGGETVSRQSSVVSRESGADITANTPSLFPLSPLRSITLDLIAGLIDKSLVQQTAPVGGEPRFAMLETIREFALEQLAASGETASIEAERAASIRDLVARAEPALLGPYEEAWQDLLDAELGNLRATFSWALEHDLRTALEIGAALWAYWAWRHLAEGRRWLTAALARPDRVDEITRARAMTTAAALASLEGDLDGAAALAEAALLVFRNDANPLSEAKALWVLGISEYLRGQVEAGISLLDESLTLFNAATTSTDRTWAAYVHSVRGAFSCLAGDLDTGLAFYAEALDRARASESQGVTLIILSDYAGWLLDVGDVVRARAMLEEALAYAPVHRGRWLIATTLIGLALADALAHQAATAARHLGAVEALRILTGMAVPPNYLGRIHRAGDLARRALGQRAFAAAWTEGHADPDAVLAAALAPSGAPAAPAGHACPDTFGLSRREREVLTLLSNGYSDREIADALYISARTVGTHVSAILRKLDAGSRAEAAVKAVRHGLD